MSTATEIVPDPYFDDEDEENEEIYRNALKNHGTLPPCDPYATPFTSVTQRCVLCSRTEAETILKTIIAAQPGHFIVRPSANENQPYSLTILYDKETVYHFQIRQKGYNLSIEPPDKINSATAKIFPTLSSFLEHYLSNTITFKDDKNEEAAITLKLYPDIESTHI